MKKSFRKVAGIGLLASAALLGGCHNAPTSSYTVQATDKTEVSVQAPANSNLVTVTMKDGKTMTCVQSYNQAAGSYTDESKLTCPVTKATSDQRIKAEQQRAKQNAQDDDDAAVMMMMSATMN
ncbi:MAG: hypothetical protein GC185_02905 [Alphaproteobacteria bacterium]|nr:hypothetical protein [Alphaproteobacteria bacterium]